MAAVTPKRPARAKRTAPDGIRPARLERFALAYRETLNATDAFIKATGFTGPRKNANHHAKRLLKDPRVQAMIAVQAMDDRAQTSINIEKIVTGLTHIAQLDPAEAFTPIRDARGRVTAMVLRNIFDMPIEVRRCIASIEVIKRNITAGDGKVDTLYKVKFSDRMDAYRILAQYVGMMNVKVEHTITAEHLAKLSDTELKVTMTDALSRWNRHVDARQRLGLPPVEGTVVE